MDGSKNLIRTPPIGERGRRLLKDLGIDVWLLRSPAGIPVPPVEAVPATPLPEVVRQQAPAPSAAEPRGERQLGVICLSTAGAVLMGPADDMRRFARFARDLVAAARLAVRAGGDGAFQEHEFFWPQPGATGDLRRAFSAFADKRLGDAGALVFMLPAELLEELAPEVAGGQVMVIPELSRLAVDPDLKRELWRKILQRFR